MPSDSKPPTPLAPPSRLRSIANVVLSQIDTAIAMAGSFVVTPAILYGLGDAGYGGWLLINSFISYMRLLDLGTSAGTVKFGAGAEGRGDTKDLARVMNTSAAIFGLLAIAALVTTLVLTRVLPTLYPAIAEGQTPTILMLGGAMVVELAFRPFGAAIRMRSMHWVYDAVEICTYSVFKLGLVLYFAYRREISYEMLALLTLGETVTRSVLCFAAALYISPAARKTNPFGAERVMVRKLVTMGAAVSVIMVADLVRFQLDAGVIGYFLPESPESISIFGVGTRLASISYMAIGVIGSILMPRFSAAAESGDKKNAFDLLRSSSLVTGLAAALLLVNLAVLGPQFLNLWLHKPWVPISGHILLIMLPGYFVALLSEPSAALLMGKGKLRGLTILTVAEALSNLALSVALVKPFGIFGVAIGTVVPLAVFRGVVFPILLKNELGLTPGEYFRLHAPAVGIGLVYLVLVGGLMFVPTPTYGRFIGLSLASATVFAVLVLAAVPAARTTLLRRLRRRTKTAATDERSETPEG